MGCFFQFETFILWSHSPELSSTFISLLVLAVVSSQNQRKLPLALSATLCTQKTAATCETLLSCLQAEVLLSLLKFPVATKPCAWDSPACPKKVSCTPCWRPGAAPHHARSEQVLVPLLEHCCGRQCGTHHLLQVFLSNNSIPIPWLRITTTSHLPPRLDWTTPGRSDNIHRHRQPGPLDPHSLSR